MGAIDSSCVLVWFGWVMWWFCAGDLGWCVCCGDWLARLRVVVVGGGMGVRCVLVCDLICYSYGGFGRFWCSILVGW